MNRVLFTCKIIGWWWSLFSFLVSFLLVNVERQRPLDISVRSAQPATVAPAPHPSEQHTQQLYTQRERERSNESPSMGCTCCYYLVEATAIKIYKTKEAVSCSPHYTYTFPGRPKKNATDKKTKQKKTKKKYKKENGIQTIIIISNLSKFIVKARSFRLGIESFRWELRCSNRGKVVPIRNQHREQTKI